MSAKYIIKILTLGEHGVGKSCIIIRYIADKFDNKTQATLAVDFKTKFIQKGNEIIKLSIFDTAGQEQYKYLIKSYYNGANGILLIFDITDRNSFEQLNSWLKDLKNNSDDLDNMFICLVGNKSDLNEKREVSYEEANKFAKEKNMPYIEVSAKTGDNINKLFSIMTKGTIIKIIEKRKNDPNAVRETIRLSFLEKEEKEVKNKRCC